MAALNKEERFTQRLLEWFNVNKRTFPWRKTTNPYKILVAELLLRKTTANQVNNIYNKFFRAFPSSNELSRATESEIAKIIRPLGLQNQRARSLHKISVELVASGGVPEEEDKLISLPGVGQYCSDAVRCLAYGYVTPMVDRNVVRVVDRVFSVLPSRMNPLGETAAKSVREFTKRSLLLMSRESRTLNLALLDFASKVCKANNPLCPSCPLEDLCDWHQC